MRTNIDDLIDALTAYHKRQGLTDDEAQKQVFEYMRAMCSGMSETDKGFRTMIDKRVAYTKALKNKSPIG